MNDAANGVFLLTKRNVSEPTYHRSLHTNKYLMKVNKELRNANSRGDVYEILDDIRERLMNGTFV